MKIFIKISLQMQTYMMRISWCYYHGNHAGYTVTIVDLINIWLHTMLLSLDHE